jgi:hypothetical protein
MIDIEEVDGPKDFEESKREDDLPEGIQKTACSINPNMAN